MYPTSTNRLFTTMLALALACMFGQSVLAQDVSEQKDIVYGTVDGKELGLDIFIPSNVSSPPLLVWVHGGRWMNGSTDGRTPIPFVDAGFAVAGLDFRQSTQARFPAMVHDVKGAVRFLRADSDDYGYNGDRMAIEPVLAEATRLYDPELSAVDACPEADFGPAADRGTFELFAPLALARVWEEVAGNLD